MKRMLFNATHLEELRVAIVDGQKLIDLDLESAIRAEKKGNIYKAVVTKVEPSLEAAFVDYGADRHGFLPLKDIYRGYFTKYDSKTPITSVKIAEEIREGQEMTVQVSKDERSAKGAALTTFISLAGRFLVLMPNNPKGGGISRQVSGEERLGLRDILANLDVGDQHALIARTAGIGRDPEELQWDLDFLLKLWETIESASAKLAAPCLIYQESNLIVRSIRDHLSADIDEIIVDDQEIYERAKRFMQQVMPHNLTKLKYYDDTVPLFSRFQIEHQIESAFDRQVKLPSGGSIVIDHSEALISIDVNSARATKGADIEETALQTNLEAVDEIARQLRIRDLGGLVVLDLIDMAESRNQRSVETQLKDALKPDRARVQIGKISRFGLLEMSRQRLRSSISDANYRACPRCEGTGTIRKVLSSSLSLLRLIEERALQENTEAIQVLLPLDMATYLLNEKRHEVNQLESRLASRIIIIPTDKLSSPQYQLKRLRRDEADELSVIPSYLQHIEIDSKEEDTAASLKSAPVEKPHIQLDQIEHDNAPVRPVEARKATEKAPRPSGKSGLFSRLWKAITGNKSAKDTPAQKRPQSATREGDAAKPATRRGGNRRGQQSRRPRDDGQQRRGGRGAGSGQNEARGGRSAGSGQDEARGGRSAGSGQDEARGGPRKNQPRPPRQSRPGQPRKPGSRGGRQAPKKDQPAHPNGQARPADDMPSTPTRRDFGAHQPEQRVSHWENRKPPGTAEKPASDHPNKLPPAPETRDLPEDFGNR